MGGWLAREWDGWQVLWKYLATFSPICGASASSSQSSNPRAGFVCSCGARWGFREDFARVTASCSGNATTGDSLEGLGPSGPLGWTTRSIPVGAHPRPALGSLARTLAGRVGWLNYS